MCMRSGPVEQLSYRDSGAPCRRRHSYSGISTLRFPLVFVLSRFLVFVPSSALRVIVVIGIFSVVRAFCRYQYRLRCSCVLSLSFVLCVSFACLDSWFVFRGLRSYIGPTGAEDTACLRASVLSFFRVSFPLRCGSFRGLVVRLFSFRVGVCVWNVPLSLYRSVVVLLCSFVPRHSSCS